MVPGEIGILPEYRGVTETPPRVNGPIWALREKRRGGQGRPHSPPPSPNRTRRGVGRRPPPPFSFPPLPFLLQQGKRGESYSQWE